MSDRSTTLYLIPTRDDSHSLVTRDGLVVGVFNGPIDLAVMKDLHTFLEIKLDSFVRIISEAITITSVGGVPCTRVTEDCDDPIIKRLAKLLGGSNG